MIKQTTKNRAGAPHRLKQRSFSPWFSFVLCALILFHMPLRATIYVYNLHYHKAEKLLAAIRPQLDKNARLSANEYQLIVNSSQSDNIKVLNILRDLDQARQSYQVELKILDAPMMSVPVANPSVANSSASSFDTQTATKSDALKPKNKRFKLTKNAKNAQYFRALALDNIPLKVNRMTKYPLTRVMFYYDQLLPTSEAFNLSNGFNLTIHQSGKQPLIVSIDLQAQSPLSANERSRLSFTASSQLQILPTQWVLFAASFSEPHIGESRALQDLYPDPFVRDPPAGNQKAQTDKISAKIPTNVAEKNIQNNAYASNKIYTTGSKPRISQWIYIKITPRPTLSPAIE